MSQIDWGLHEGCVRDRSPPRSGFDRSLNPLRISICGPQYEFKTRPGCGQSFVKCLVFDLVLLDLTHDS